MMTSSSDDRVDGQHHPKHKAGANPRTNPSAGAGGELGDVVVRVEGLTVRKGRKEVLKGLDLSLLRGSITGLFGPSGCGKTTLMRSIVGVQKVQGGSIEVLGKAPGAKELRSRVGYVTQAAAVYKDLTLSQNVHYFAKLYGADQQRVRQTIEAVGLADQARQRVSSMSGGQASRASLACALVAEPDFLVLDEPTVGLDPVTREELWDYFHGIAAGGTSILVSSHVMDEAGHCDHLVLMRDGAVLETTTPDELLASTDTTTFDRAFLAVIAGGKPA